MGPWSGYNEEAEAEQLLGGHGSLPSDFAPGGGSQGTDSSRIFPRLQTQRRSFKLEYVHICIYYMYTHAYIKILYI